MMYIDVQCIEWARLISQPVWLPIAREVCDEVCDNWDILRWPLPLSCLQVPCLDKGRRWHGVRRFQAHLHWAKAAASTQAPKNIEEQGLKMSKG